MNAQRPIRSGEASRVLKRHSSQVLRGAYWGAEELLAQLCAPLQSGEAADEVALVALLSVLPDVLARRPPARSRAAHANLAAVAIVRMDTAHTRGTRQNDGLATGLRPRD